ncbi:MAG: DeoR/GlpR family DNA-binding transcription regulator [Brevinema sp.]
MKESQQEIIYQILKKHKRISNKELSQICNLSLPTIRKYTEELVLKHKAQHIYGGIEIVDSHDNSRTIKDFHRIAKEAVKFINDGDSIFLGPGKTVATLCSYLVELKNLTVFTNSVYVIEALSEYSDITVIMIGGLYQRGNKCFSLLDNEHILNVNISKIFISGAGMNPLHGVYHSIPSNRHTEEIFAKQAEQVFLLVDQSKFGINKPFVLMPIDLVDTIITTDDISKQYITELKNKNIAVILAKK